MPTLAQDLRTTITDLDNRHSTDDEYKAIFSTFIKTRLSAKTTWRDRLIAWCEREEAQDTQDALSAIPQARTDKGVLTMPKFNVNLTQQHIFYITASVKDIETATPEEAFAEAKARDNAGMVKWTIDRGSMDLGPLEVEVEQDNGPSVSWRKED